MKKVLRLSGLDCAVCATELEEKIGKLKGVVSASVSFVNQKLTVEYIGEETLANVIAVANRFENVQVLKDENDGGKYEAKEKKYKKDWLRIGLSAVLFLVGFLFEKGAFGANAPMQTLGYYIAYGTAYAIVGYSVLFATIKNLCKGKIFDENFLMTVASVGAICIGEFGEGVVVMLLYQLGETLQSLAVASSRRSVSELMNLKSEYATVLQPSNACACGCCHESDCYEHDCHESDCYEHDCHESDCHEPSEHAHTRTQTHQKRVTPEEIQIGDILLVKAGEKIPVDGELISAIASIDAKSLTGESEFLSVRRGEELLSGCLNTGDAFEMRATRPYEDSAVSRILDMVENASSRKAVPEKFITKFAKIYTPLVCLTALLVAVVFPLASGVIAEQRLYFRNYERFLRSALACLVVSCPCALVISVPLTYFSGIGACASRGVLVKGATYLDALARVKTVALDKTGTLTEGNFVVCGVCPERGVEEKELLSLVASVEKTSSHPIAKAFEHTPTAFAVENVVEKAGKGLTADCNGERVLVGNLSLLQEYGVSCEEKRSAYTLLYVAKAGRFLGAVEVGDKLRKETKTAIARLRKLAVSRIVILTGDNRERTEKIANEAGVYEFNANLLPDGKLEKAEALKADLKKSGTLIYVGDGLNDAPVMSIADCAVSMGKLGSATAVEASDIVLVADDLTALPRGVEVARKTRKIVMQNIVFSIFMKVVFMALGAFGVLPLALAVFGDVGVMLLAVLNAFRVRFLRKK